MTRTLRRLLPALIVTILVLAASLRVAQAAWTQSPNSQAVKFTHACAAGTAPTDNLDGIQLAGLHSVTVVLEAAAAQTLSGGGNLRAWLYDPAFGTSPVWMRVPGWDIAVPATAAGQRRAAIPPVEILGGRGRLAYVTDTVTVSGGTCTIWILGATRKQ